MRVCMLVYNREINKAFQCGYEGVARECGQEVASIQHRFMVQSMAFVLEDMNCKISGCFKKVISKQSVHSLQIIMVYSNGSLACFQYKQT